MKRSFPSNAVVGAAGENLVLSHLLRLNYIAGLAPYNTKDYDLIILSEDEAVAKSIQVKTALFKEELHIKMGS
jgi:predicted AAA+ superfamily ATPase